MTAELVTAAYPTFRAGRRRYVVVVARGKSSARHHETASLHEAWRIVAAYPPAPTLIIRLPQETP